MKVNRQLAFWLVYVTALVLLFSRSLGGIMVSLFFVTFLLPVVFSTSLFFNYYLVPKYLLQGKRTQFTLYFIYMLIVSIYLELLVMILAFVILADYQIANLGKIASDIYLLTIILYLVVFANGFMEVFRRLKSKELMLSEIEEKKELEKLGTLLLRVNRKNIRVELNKIMYIESLSDYVQVHSTDKIYTTKEKISTLERTLPESFVRIHRSFLVNLAHISAFNKEEVSIADQKLTIGRKYKKEALELLESALTVDSTTPHSNGMN